MRAPVRIRDPIHGTQRVTKSEIAVIDCRAVQRLRGIKQLGLADLAYPGATHTRYAHALGVMHLAGRMFDAVTLDMWLDPADHHRLRTTVRLAALFHDLGHAPLSHSTELLMPPLAELKLGPWAGGHPGRRATHEDYTLAILLSSGLSELVRERFDDQGVAVEDVASILSDHPPSDFSRRFVIDGRDWRPLLRQCVSSELDADRMDYLLRDSYYAGVPYGRYDLEWLLEHLRPVERPPASENGPRPLHLGLASRASFGFEDYLLSRYHMFLAVYLHHVPVGYELMLDALNREEAEGADAMKLPADVDAYLEWDDLHFFYLLRRSSNPWARRLVERRGFRLLVERTQQDSEQEPLRRGQLPIREVVERLRSEGIAVRAHDVKGKLSKYFSPEMSFDPIQTPHLPGLAPSREEAPTPTLFVVEEGRAVPLEAHVALYRRYRDEVSLERVYVAPEDMDRARMLLEQMEP